MQRFVPKDLAEEQAIEMSRWLLGRKLSVPSKQAVHALAVGLRVPMAALFPAGSVFRRVLADFGTVDGSRRNTQRCTYGGLFGFATVVSGKRGLAFGMPTRPIYPQPTIR